MLALLKTFSWQELRHHPWRNASAVVAVMLGVALALAVHLINASALSEFAGAVSSVNGQPDLDLRARQGLLDDRLLDRVAAQPGVAIASPVLEWNTTVRTPDGEAVAVRVVGVDALSVAGVSPALMPRTDTRTAAVPRVGGSTFLRPTRCTSTRPRAWRWEPAGRISACRCRQVCACRRCGWRAR